MKNLKDLLEDIAPYMECLQTMRTMVNPRPIDEGDVRLLLCMLFRDLESNNFGRKEKVSTTAYPQVDHFAELMKNELIKHEDEKVHWITEGVKQRNLCTSLIAQINNLKDENTDIISVEVPITNLTRLIHIANYCMMIYDYNIVYNKKRSIESEGGGEADTP